MKKIVLLLMTLAGALTVQGRVHTLQEMAERAYNFLTFEMTDGAKVSVAISSLTLTINGNTLTAGSQTFTLSNLSKMYFSNTSGIRTLDLPTSGATAWTTTGIHMGTFNSHEEALSHLPKGIYIIKSSAGTIKTIVK